MNVVSLTARVVVKPEVRTNRAGIAECRLRLAVPRYSRTGVREPGVVYLDATTFGLEAREHAERLSVGSEIGLSGRLDADPPDAGVGVLIDQLDFL